MILEQPFFDDDRIRREVQNSVRQITINLNGVERLFLVGMSFVQENGGLLLPSGERVENAAYYSIVTAADTAHLGEPMEITNEMIDSEAFPTKIELKMEVRDDSTLVVSAVDSLISLGKQQFALEVLRLSEILSHAGRLRFWDNSVSHQMRFYPQGHGLVYRFEEGDNPFLLGDFAANKHYYEDLFESQSLFLDRSGNLPY